MAVDAKIVDFLQAKLDEGHPWETVVAILEKGGYSQEDIDDVSTKLVALEEESDRENRAQEESSELFPDEEQAEDKSSQPPIKESKDLPSSPAQPPLPEELNQDVPAENFADQVPDALSITKEEPVQMQSYFSMLKALLFAPQDFLDMKRHTLQNAFGTYIKTLFLVLPLNFIGLFVIDLVSAKKVVASSLGPKVLLVLVALLAGYIAISILFLLLILPIHFSVYLFGGRGGIKETFSALFYALTPAMFFFWLPGINLLYGFYSKVLFYETIKRYQKLAMGHAFWSLVVGVLFTYAIVTGVVLAVVMSMGLLVLPNF